MIHQAFDRGFAGGIHDLGVLGDLAGLHRVEAAGEPLGESDAAHEYAPTQADLALNRIARNVEGSGHEDFVSGHDRTLPARGPIAQPLDLASFTFGGAPGARLTHGDTRPLFPRGWSRGAIVVVLHGEGGAHSFRQQSGHDHDAFTSSSEGTHGVANFHGMCRLHA